jgi:hypothetical protein
MESREREEEEERETTAATHMSRRTICLPHLTSRQI